MQIGLAHGACRKQSAVASFLAVIFALLAFVTASSTRSQAIPAFARKYGLPCSACHETWPKLNVFGQTFKDNGYQLMNDRDSPIWQNPSYWPVTFRITPMWHRESTNRVAVDLLGGGTPGGPAQTEARITSHGFDLSGLDILTGGTLFNNISFLLTPSSDNTASFHFESAWVRFDNLLHSPWLNVKVGKFELDNIISEKRIETLSNNGGFYQLYHFVPPGSNNTFGQMGDNQLGFEIMGHSVDDRTRASLSIFSSNDGNVNLPNGNSYSGFFNFTQSFNAGYAGGVDKVGAYIMAGEAPVFYLSSGATGTPSDSGTFIPGSGRMNKGYHREGVYGDFYLKRLDFNVFFQHGWDNMWFMATPGYSFAGPPVLPTGAQAPTWNGFFEETHFTVNPQLFFIERTEFVRMSRQGIAGTDSKTGDIDAYTVGFRYYPFMFSRAGFAFHNEYSIVKAYRMAPITGLNLTSSSAMIGFDFDF